VLPLHALVFDFWFIMMNPGFIPSDDAIQEVIAFTTVSLQKTVAVSLAVAFRLFCQMSGHPTYSNIVEPKNVVH